MNSQVHIQTHKILLDLIGLNVLRNSCTVPYLFYSVSKYIRYKNKYLIVDYDVFKNVNYIGGGVWDVDYLV